MKSAWLARLEEGLIASLLATMTLVTFTQVVARYIFNYSFVWALELTTFLFGALIFLGMSYGVKLGTHIGVDALVKAMPPKAARITAIVATILCLIFSAIVFVGGWIYVSKMHQIGILAQDIPIPQWVPRLVMPIGFAMLFLRFGHVLILLLQGKEAHLLGDEAKDALKMKQEETPAEQTT
jgi:C4-dicarboxylate transporter DctQ subunit